MFRKICAFAGLLLLTSCGSPAGTSLPVSLSSIEGMAEDTYDKALVDEFGTVQQNADAIARDWSQLRPQAKHDGATAETLSGMDSAVMGLERAPRERVPAARAANQISSFMDELFGLYSPPVPTEITALDYLGREVVLDGLGEDLDAATRDLAELERVWSEVRVRVIARKGNREADAYDAHVAAIQESLSAKDASMIPDQANVGLELVDAMEELFE